MDTETVLASIVAKVAPMLQAVVEEAEQEERPSLYALEERVQAALPRIGQIVLQALVGAQGTGLVGPERPCACGAQQQYHDRSRPLSVTSSVGPIDLAQRAYYTCAQCGAHSMPLDEQLGVGPAGGTAGRMSRYLQEQCAWLLALLPGRLAQHTLVRFGWPAVAPSSLRVRGQGLGAEMDTREHEQQAQAQAAVLRPAAPPGVPRQAPQSERLYAAPDGVMYCTTARDEQTGAALWRELKVAAVYEAESSPAVSPPRAPTRMPAASLPRAPTKTTKTTKMTARARISGALQTQQPAVAVPAADQAVRVTYVAETGPWQDFGRRLWAELWARGLSRPIADLAVVADGSAHIDQVVEDELRLPGIQLTRILDLAHAQQHLWDVAKARFGDGGEGREGRSAAATWVQPLLEALEQGQVGAVVSTLQRVAEQDERDESQSAAVVRTARQAAAYFAARRAQVDYPRFVASGYQIGSGLAESACKRFGTDRMKGTGMRWTVPGAQQVATLRMFVLSDRWDEVSTYCRSAA